MNPPVVPVPLGLYAGYGRGENQQNNQNSQVQGLHVVSTAYPQYSYQGLGPGQLMGGSNQQQPSGSPAFMVAVQSSGSMQAMQGQEQQQTSGMMPIVVGQLNGYHPIPFQDGALVQGSLPQGVQTHGSCSMGQQGQQMPVSQQQQTHTSPTQPQQQDQEQFQGCPNFMAHPVGQARIEVIQPQMVNLPQTMIPQAAIPPAEQEEQQPSSHQPQIQHQQQNKHNPHLQQKGQVASNGDPNCRKRKHDTKANAKSNDCAKHSKQTVSTGPKADNHSKNPLNGQTANKPDPADQVNQSRMPGVTLCERSSSLKTKMKHLNHLNAKMLCETKGVLKLAQKYEEAYLEYYKKAYDLTIRVKTLEEVNCRLEELAQDAIAEVTTDRQWELTARLNNASKVNKHDIECGIGMHAQAPIPLILPPTDDEVSTSPIVSLSKKTVGKVSHPTRVSTDQHKEKWRNQGANDDRNDEEKGKRDGTQHTDKKSKLGSEMFNKASAIEKTCDTSVPGKVLDGPITPHKIQTNGPKSFTKKLSSLYDNVEDRGGGQIMEVNNNGRQAPGASSSEQSSSEVYNVQNLHNFGQQNEKRIATKETYAYRIVEGDQEPQPIKFTETYSDPHFPRRLQKVTPFAHRDLVCSIEIAKDSHTVLTGGKGTVKMWNIDRRHHIAEMACMREGYVRGMKLIEDNNTLLMGGECSSMYLWDLNGSKPTRKSTFRSNALACYALDVSPDAKTFYSCHSDGMINVWDIHNKKLIRKIDGHRNGVSSIRIAPDGSKILSGGLDGTLRIWDAGSAKEVACYEFPSRVFSLDICPTAYWVSVALSNGDIEMVNLEDTSSRIRLSFHESCVFSLSYAESGKWFATCGKDGQLNIFESFTGRHLYGNREEWPLLKCAVSRDGKYLIAGSRAKCGEVFEVEYGAAVAA
eukprot:Clim_evm17s5 gene=Clim_evmTU17s5